MGHAECASDPVHAGLKDDRIAAQFLADRMQELRDKRHLLVIRQTLTYDHVLECIHVTHEL